MRKQDRGRSTQKEKKPVSVQSKPSAKPTVKSKESIERLASNEQEMRNNEVKEETDKSRLVFSWLNPFC